eukprot:gene442-792_t
MHKLTWKNVSYFIDAHRRNKEDGSTKRRPVLYRVSGSVNSCQLFAIMGPSGSGKSSLLNALAGRLPRTSKGKLTGQVLYDGNRLFKSSSPNNFERVIGYVTQDDALFPYLTTRETLLMSAYFRLSTSSSNRDREDIVNSLLFDLGLTDVAESFVGGKDVRGISGGERKRLAIGVQLISLPDVVLLDEPTSGLDAFQAQSVMEAMRMMSNKGKVILAAIHQPRAAIFEMFDQLLILAEGATVYLGPAPNTIEYFSNRGFICPLHHNPPDFFLDIVSVDRRSDILLTASRKRIRFLLSNWDLFAHGNEVNDDGEDVSNNNVNTRDESSGLPYETTPSPEGGILPITQRMGQACHRFGLELQALTWRAFVCQYRDLPGLAIRAVTSAFFAVIISLIFQNLGHTQRSIQDRIGLLYFIVLNQSFNPTIGALTTFTVELYVTRRERASGAYSSFPYFLSRVLCELSVLAILTTFFGIIVYWPTNLNRRVDKFFIFLALLNLGSWSSLAVGLTISAVSPSLAIANAMAAPVLIIFILFSGFYINLHSLPPGSDWVSYISFVKWAFESLAINEFSGASFECSVVNLQQGNCQQTGSDVLKRLSFQNGLEMTVVPFIGLCIGYYIIAYICLCLNREKFLRFSSSASLEKIPEIETGTETAERGERSAGEKSVEMKDGETKKQQGSEEMKQQQCSTEMV